MSYHHGNLRKTLLTAAATAVAENGAAALSLRALAREAGVSHTAPRHHFGDKRGLLTALATDGYERLAAALRATGDDFLEVGVAYVRFALEHPGHFAVMFQPELVDESEPALASARLATRTVLLRGSGTLGGNGSAGPAKGVPKAAADPKSTRPTRQDALERDGTLPPLALLAWGAAHGLATLALNGALSRMGMGSNRDAALAASRRALAALRPQDG